MPKAWYSVTSTRLTIQRPIKWYKRVRMYDRVGTTIVYKVRYLIVSDIVRSCYRRLVTTFQPAPVNSSPLPRSIWANHIGEIRATTSGRNSLLSQRSETRYEFLLAKCKWHIIDNRWYTKLVTGMNLVTSVLDARCKSFYSFQRRLYILNLLQSNFSLFLVQDLQIPISFCWIVNISFLWNAWEVERNKPIF